MVSVQYMLGRQFLLPRTDFISTRSVAGDLLFIGLVSLCHHWCRVLLVSDAVCQTWIWTCGVLSVCGALLTHTRRVRTRLAHNLYILVPIITLLHLYYHLYRWRLRPLLFLPSLITCHGWVCQLHCNNVVCVLVLLVMSHVTCHISMCFCDIVAVWLAPQVSSCQKLPIRHVYLIFLVSCLMRCYSINSTAPNYEYVINQSLFCCSPQQHTMGKQLSQVCFICSSSLVLP